MPLATFSRVMGLMSLLSGSLARPTRFTNKSTLPARAEPHVHRREAVGLLDVPAAGRQQEQRCPARADPHG